MHWIQKIFRRLFGTLCVNFDEENAPSEQQTLLKDLITRFPENPRRLKNDPILGSARITGDSTLRSARISATATVVAALISAASVVTVACLAASGVREVGREAKVAVTALTNQVLVRCEESPPDLIEVERALKDIHKELGKSGLIRQGQVACSDFAFGGGHRIVFWGEVPQYGKRAYEITPPAKDLADAAKLAIDEYQRVLSEKVRGKYPLGIHVAIEGSADGGSISNEIDYTETNPSGTCLVNGKTLVTLKPGETTIANNNQAILGCARALGVKQYLANKIPYSIETVVEGNAYQEQDEIGTWRKVRITVWYANLYRQYPRLKESEVHLCPSRPVPE